MKDQSSYGHGLSEVLGSDMQTLHESPGPRHIFRDLQVGTRSARQVEDQTDGHAVFADPMDRIWISMLVFLIDLAKMSCHTIYQCEPKLYEPSRGLPTSTRQHPDGQN